MGSQQKSDQVSEQNKVVLAALGIVIDGMACSTAGLHSQQAGAYLAGLILADMKGQLDTDKQKAILSIIEMASEVDSPVFMAPNK